MTKMLRKCNFEIAKMFDFSTFVTKKAAFFDEYIHVKTSYNCAPPKENMLLRQNILKQLRLAAPGGTRTSVRGTLGWAVTQPWLG